MYRSGLPSQYLFLFADSANTIQAGVQSTSESTTHTNQDIDDIYVLLDSLDPHLRPATPDYSDPQSVAVYEEHKQLAKEYWKVSRCEKVIDPK